jgi:ribosomal protein L11 methyltransferase
VKTYKEFQIRTNPFLPEIVTGVLWELNISGLMEEENFLKVFVNEDDISKSVIKKLLGKLMEEQLITDFSVEEKRLENRNWNEEWEKNLNVIRVTDKIVIKPSYKEYKPLKSEIVITIDPKMSFGTGEHQTTKLMLKLIEKHLKQGMKILDVGSGTAVLSIAAIKLGAELAIAIDDDELCLVYGNENCRINSIENKIDIRTGEIKDIEEKDFDLVFANIQKNVLIEIADQIKYRLKEDGLVFLSGLLDGDERDIVKHYTKIEFQLIDKLQLDEWIAVAFRN